MNESQAKAVAESLGGSPWQTGGGIWVVYFQRPGGRLVVVSEDAVMEYPDRAAWDAGAPAATILLKD